MNKSGEITSDKQGQADADSGAEDSALVGRCLQGEAEPFEQLFVKYRQKVFAVAWRMLHDEELALDVVQDTFVRAYEQLERLKGETRFFPWLRRIAVNLSIDRLRQQKRNVQVSLDAAVGGDEEQGSYAERFSTGPSDDSPVRAAEVAELSSALAAALTHLSENHRTVFVLHAAEGMSYQEIAETLDCSIGTVMSRLFYARKKLQELLAPHLKED